MAHLAIDGGRPVRATMLPYGRQTVDEEDIRAVVETLRSDWLTTGPAVAAFEQAFASRVGARHAVTMASGTAALHAAAFAAGFGPEAEVITTPMTFAASANCILYQQASPVFADVRADTLALDPDLVRAALTPRTRGIVVVDYAGLPADLDELRAIAQEGQLVLIEDAAHALGATYRGRRVGSIAAMTTFSLHPVKQVTTGEGGVVTTEDDEFAERLRRFRNHGITRDSRTREATATWEYAIEALGYNYRLTDFQCALGRSQLTKLDSWIRRRREIAGRYAAAWAAHPAIELPHEPDDRQSAWHLYTIRLRLDRLTADRRTIFRALRAENIGVNVHYIPVPWHPLYERLGYRRGSWPVAEAAYERLLSLPMWAGMTDRDVDDVVAGVEKVLGAYGR